MFVLRYLPPTQGYKVKGNKVDVFLSAIVRVDPQRMRYFELVHPR